MTIKVKLDTSGLDKLRKKMSEAAKPESVPLSELMPENFMVTYTQFRTLQEMFDASGIESPDDLKSDDWNTFVAEHTQFDGWSSMMKKAGALRLKQKLNL
jgi:hypothetical protein